MQRLVIQTALIGSMLLSILLASLTLPLGGVQPVPGGLLAVLALICQLAVVVLRAHNWSQLVSQIRPVPPMVGLQATLIGFAANNLLPLRIGELVRAYLMANSVGISRLAVLASVLVERLVDSLVLAGLLALFAGLFSLTGHAGAGWLLTGAGMAACAAAMIAALIAILASRNRRVLALIGAGTGLFNDDARDRLRMGFWSAGHFLRMLRLRPRVLLRFVLVMAVVWAGQLAALLSMLSLLLPPGDGLTRAAQAVSTYLAISLPALPASVGSFEPIFLLFASRIDAVLPNPGHVAFWVWASMMVPVTVTGMALFLARPRFGTRPETSVTGMGPGPMMRDRPRAREMSDALASYFRALGTMHAAEDHGLRGRGHLRRQFKGGSDQLTILVEQDDGLIVRKLAPEDRAGKLIAQRDWLVRHAATGLCPRVLDWQVGEGHARLDLELLDTATPFFAHLHSVPPAEAAAMLAALFETLESSVYKPAPEAVDEPAIRRYVESKIIGKLDETAAALPALAPLMAAEAVTVNGRPATGLRQAAARILAGGAPLADLSRIRAADIHGDLTVDNLLALDGRLRLLDPNNENAVTDPVVDMAKMAQSLHSGYEFLVDVKTAQLSGTRIDFADHRSAAYDAVWRLFLDRARAALPPHTVRALMFHEAVHFTRMLPYRVRIRPETAALFYGVAAARMQDFLDQYE